MIVERGYLGPWITTLPEGRWPEVRRALLDVLGFDAQAGALANQTFLPPLDFTPRPRATPPSQDIGSLGYFATPTGIEPVLPT
jgi:hypothetical protein